MKKDKVYVFGHRNPDTDSVTASIALAYLKRKQGINAIPVVLSSTNLETKYALNYFNVKEPKFLNDVKIKIKDLDYPQKYNVTEDNSINEAYQKMSEADVSKIPIVDENKKLLGIITMKDIAKEQFSSKIDLVNASYESILNTIDGEEVLKFDESIKGNLLIASYNTETLIEDVELNNNTILMVGDRHNIIEYAIKNKVKLIIITGPNSIKKEHLELARLNKVNIINTKNSTILAARKINLSNKVVTLDYETNISVINENDSVSDFIKFANKTKYSYYPVINNEDKCTGILRLSDIVYNNKQKVILVDHNNKEQSAIGIEEAEILEIIDHHNIGSIGTNMPINFRNMPVGSTDTIINLLYEENNIDIPPYIAGLMLSGILSDTLILTSPTTTDIDRKAVDKLSNIAGVDYKEYGLKMLKAGSSLKGKTKEQILYTDYKKYPVDDKTIGIGQIFTTNPTEILNSTNEYIELLNNVSIGNDYYFVIFIITDIINKGSYIIYSNRAKEILEKVFKKDNIEQGSFLEGIVSRKKQILPYIMLEMENDY